jgi:hypothetical protein
MIDKLNTCWRYIHYCPKDKSGLKCLSRIGKVSKKVNLIVQIILPTKFGVRSLRGANNNMLRDAAPSSLALKLGFMKL